MEFSGWDVGAVAAKALLYAATLGACGAIFFLEYAAGIINDPQRALIRRLIGVQLMAAALLSLIRILLLTGSMTGSISGMFDRDMARMLLEAGEGTASSLRLAGLALAAGALTHNRLLQLFALLGAALAASSFAWVGHVHALQPVVPAMLLSTLHLLGVAFWVGALLPLLWCARGDARRVGAIAARFGSLAVFVVALLVMAGLGLLWMLGAGHAEFWSSGYGKMIAVKLFLVTLLLGAAAVNKLSLTPQLVNGNARAMMMLLRSIQLELMAAGLILLITAALTSLLGPPR